MDKPKPGRDAVVFAEYRLLNALLKSSTYLEDSRVHEGVFLHETARSLYQAIQQLTNQGIPVSPASLFQAANEIDFSVTLGVVESVMGVDPEGASNLNDILHTLAKAVEKKELMDQVSILQKALQAPGDVDNQKLVEYLDRISLVATGVRTQSPLQDFSQWTDNYIEDLEQRAKGKRYPYGDDYLDSFVLKGAYPGAITTIAAGTGQGKSTYVLNLINSMINTHTPGIYISLEMSGVDTYDRLIALRKKIPIQDLYANDASIHSIIEIVKQEKKELEKNKKFFFVEEPNLAIPQIRSLIKEFKQRTGSEYAIVAIDLVTQLKDFMSSSGGMSVANTMERGMNDLNALAKEQNVHIIAVVQFNREAENVRIHTIEDLDHLRPTLANIKNSAAIAERSRVVLSLFRKKFYSDRYLSHLPEAATLIDTAEITILKNSSGPVGKTFQYLFEGETFTMTPFVEDESDPESDALARNFSGGY